MLFCQDFKIVTKKVGEKESEKQDFHVRVYEILHRESLIDIKKVMDFFSLWVFLSSLLSNSLETLAVALLTTGQHHMRKLLYVNLMDACCTTCSVGTKEDDTQCNAIEMFVQIFIKSHVWNFRLCTANK